MSGKLRVGATKCSKLCSYKRMCIASPSLPPIAFLLLELALFENIYLCTSFRDILQHHHKTFQFFSPFFLPNTLQSPSIPKHTFFSRFNFEVWEIFLIEAQNVKTVSYLCWPCLLPRQGYCV